MIKVHIGRATSGENEEALVKLINQLRSTIAGRPGYLSSETASNGSIRRARSWWFPNGSPVFTGSSGMPARSDWTFKSASTTCLNPEPDTKFMNMNNDTAF